MTSPSLRPLQGPPREVYALVRDWLLAERDPEPLVVRTSGSTGGPKDVLLGRGALLASARATEARLGGPGQWLLNLAPTYVAGLQVLVRSAVAGIEPVYADEHEDLAAAVAALSGRRAYVSLVPTQLHRLAEAGELGLLGRFDAVLLGGAAASPELLRAAAEARVPVVRTYGMSETCGGCVYDGVPLDGIALRIGADRRVHLAGPVLFDGYAGDPAATREVLRDGWFATSDLGELDLDGRLRIIGRLDDVVISGGANIALPVVTAAVREHPEVDDAVLLGVDDPEWGTRVVAFVVGEVALESLRDAVEAAGLPRAWAPRQLVRLSSLPLLANGKPDRVGLRARAVEERR